MRKSFRKQAKTIFPIIEEWRGYLASPYTEYRIILKYPDMLIITPDYQSHEMLIIFYNGRQPLVLVKAYFFLTQAANKDAIAKILLKAVTMDLLFVERLVKTNPRYSFMLLDPFSIQFFWRRMIGKIIEPFGGKIKI